MKDQKEKQVRFLAQWLKEYELAQTLIEVDEVAEVEEVDPADTNQVPMVAPSPFHKQVEPGQIRLLSAALTPQAKRPVYVAVLRRDCEVPPAWLVVPFSAYSVPATPQELCLRQESSIALRTLCFWNRRVVHEAILVRSWLVDELSPTERERCERVLQAVEDAALPWCELLDDVGAPIVRKDDPRRDYIETERRKLDDLEDKPAEDDKESSRCIYRIEPSKLKKVAEERAAYGTPKGHSEGKDESDDC